MKRAAKLFLILLFAFSCNEEQDATNEIVEAEPAVTEIGIPTGDAVTKEIGSGGGTISTTDGKLDVVVPGGAVTTNTPFSIQEITNFCPGGRYAYRLLPEGLTFANPVTLTFHYTDEELENTLIDFLGIAFQASDRVWYLMPTEVNSSNKTISTRATHFTDWSVLSQIEISPRTPRVPQLEPGKTLQLMVIGSESNSPKPPPSSSPDPNEDDLPALPPAAPFKIKWSVNGKEDGDQDVGTITGQGIGATYQAPAREPANNPVAISAKLTGFKTWDFVNKRRKSFNEVIVFKYVKITDEHNYTLRIEETLLKYVTCPRTGNFKDVVEMDIKVKGADVTISNIKNYPPTLDPKTYTSSGSCTLTCEPGTVGALNVTSGSGARWPAPDPGDGYYRFNLHLNNETQGQGAHTTLSCPNEPDKTAPSSSPDIDVYMTFILNNSPQEVKIAGTTFTLTPKEN